MLIFLLDFNPIKPDLGLILWTTVFFLGFWFLIGRSAFRPIANALKSREEDIQSALDEAKKAKEEMANMKAENERILADAREERSKILKEAKDMKNNIVNEAKDQAKLEATKIVSTAKTEIENQKRAAITEVKNSAGIMALEIAEKVIKKELKGKPEHEDYVNKLVDGFNLN